MREDFVPVYMASTVAVAQKLADRLTRSGIESFVDDTESPLYGMSLGPQSKVVHVRTPAEPRAREIIRDFQKQYDPPRPEDAQNEETGLELPKAQRPSDDSPNEPYSPGIESMARSADPPAPETAYMGDESGRRRETHQDEVASLGADRPPFDEPDVEADDIEEQPIDELNVDERIDVEELEHPAASPPERRKNRRGRRSR
jgi:hypothetical protein